MKIAYLFVLPFLFGFILPPEDRKIDPTEFVIPFLEELVIEKINQLRTKKRLPALVHDSILYVSSKYHCDYMVKSGKLSHYESGTRSMKTPQDRAEKFGMSGYWIGENVLYSYFNSNVNNGKNAQFKTYTYEILAEAILHSWVTSKSHFENMINPDNTLSGLALSVDFETKRVYVCQDFGKRKN